MAMGAVAHIKRFLDLHEGTEWFFKNGELYVVERFFATINPDGSLTHHEPEIHHVRGMSDARRALGY